MDSTIRNRHYRNVDNKRLQVIDDFRETHKVKSIEIKGKRADYICSGTGNRGFLTFHGFSCIAEICYKDFLKHERDFKVISPTMAGIRTLDEMSEMVNAILDAEGIDRLVIKGSSYGGFIAQAYFDRNFNKVDGLILSHTYPPRKSSVNYDKNILKFAKILPFFIVRKYVKRFLLKLSDFRIQDEEIMQKLMLARGFVSEIVEEKLNKEILTSQVSLLADFDGMEDYDASLYKKWEGTALILTSDNDIGFKYHDILTSHYPNAEIHIFKDSGHASGILREADYTRYVAEFLERIK